jgi:hypothetical protein
MLNTTIQSRSFEEKHLQDHEETLIHTLVVNLPIAIAPLHQEITPSRSCATPPREKKSKTRAKSLSQMRASLL